MKFRRTTLQGVYCILPDVFGDKRGFFLETYSKSIFTENGIEVDFVQDNYSRSEKKGVLRGLHFQRPPQAQAKLIRVTKGSVYDVIVDLRKKSPSFGRWEGFKLSADNFKMLFIPKGFAHGFCTLEEGTEFMYKVDDFYAPEAEDGIIWNDSMLNIDWPVAKPILSEKDKKLKNFKTLNNPF